ncbi:hypothetical protein DUNSADRAFT_2124 [Dunaliella salina]|uniref:Uncharacterized protein n=1 Tax=Dunaliella salina TaxID=3046 RepID=A0ABQ7FWL9_DUNSA|nr:hypothetical protein DUNSADRAFT_2124 [Dunaliella salina]|eukprot:KAF5826754.1 hypothetical protein DUNSADRAFT_2124 [Dunaliella salina]
MLALRVGPPSAPAKSPTRWAWRLPVLPGVKSCRLWMRRGKWATTTTSRCMTAAGSCWPLHPRPCPLVHAHARVQQGLNGRRENPTPGRALAPPRARTSQEAASWES